MDKPIRSLKRALAVLLAALLLAVACASSACYRFDFTDTGTDDYSYVPETPPELDFVVVDLDEPLTIETYEDNMIGTKRYLSIYDSEYYDLFFDRPSVSAEECISHIDSNPDISEQYKEFLRKFVSSIAAKYPGADLRPLDLNVRTLKVVECDQFELALHAVSIDAYGCYVRAENTIYVPKDYLYRPGTWEYQVIMHEFGHVARTVTYNDDETSLWIDMGSTACVIPEEALNSVFTVSLFDYEERDIAYQLQSNMFLVLLDCVEDYTLSDYLNHSFSYFVHKLDLSNGDNNYAMGILKLIDEQRTDGMNDDYDRDQEVYYPIYHYLTKMYLNKYSVPGMTSEEIDALVDRLLDIVMFDVPVEYHIDTAEFYRFAREYYQG